MFVQSQMVWKSRIARYFGLKPMESIFIDIILLLFQVWVGHIDISIKRSMIYMRKWNLLESYNRFFCHEKYSVSLWLFLRVNSGRIINL